MMWIVRRNYINDKNKKLTNKIIKNKKGTVYRLSMLQSSLTVLRQNLKKEVANITKLPNTYIV